ncbi:heavy metal-associated isoprenylated plant protein 3 [Lycium ferocissimum]|uniref:heavy metal-associated isoprenylated plant protein 3 n=1 Tax=Lycium ferocissimum TaxID=112874 RepID=UPI002815100E|nr:heavy metal-associated isoprenylated plant protein 3 [Lycium ferocissimum]
MGKNKSMKNIEGDMKSEEQQKKEGGKNEGNQSVVLKVDFHCDGCVRKIIKVVRSFEGVEKVICDNDANKVTAIGKVDPLKLKEKMERKLKKPVQLISPLPKDCKKEKNQNENDTKGTKGDDKKNKEKEPPVTTTVLKLHLHCEGCIEKMHKIITKNKGYKEMKIDHEKDLVTVTGSIDMKELVEELKKKLKKDVEIVPPKKEGGEKKDGGDGKGKAKDGQGGGDNKVVNNGMHNEKDQFGYPYMDQIFSDENPNACSIM